MPHSGPDSVSRPPRLRLSGFYAAYFAALGILIPFWPLYLEQLGCPPSTIGAVMGMVPATKMVMPTFWGWVADRTGKTLSLIRWASCLSALSLSFLLPFREDIRWVVGTFLIFGLFWNGTLPLFETVTLAHLRGRGGYGRVRLWGSVGFVVSVSLGGFLLGETFPIGRLPELMVLLLSLQWMMTLTVPGVGLFHPKREGHSFLKILSNPGVWTFLGSAFLLQCAHGPYYALYTIWLQQWGYSDGETGLFWALGVIAEVILFVWIDPLERRLGLRAMFLLSLLSGVLRWPMIGWFPESPLILVLAQILHAGSFGLMHVTSIALIHRHFEGPYHARGQAVFSAVVYGMGGALGSFAGGALWDLWSPPWVFALASLLSVAGLLLALPWVGRPLHPKGGP